MRYLAVLLSLWLGGCAALRGDRQPNEPGAEAFKTIPVTGSQIRSEAMSLADTYVTMLAQPLDQLRAHPAANVRLWALEVKLATANAAYTDAVNPNEAVAFLDLVSLIALKRRAMEEHWIPTLLGKDEVGLLAAHREGEKLAWEAAGRVLTEPQAQELRAVIEGWAERHPGQYYVSHIRFSEFAAERSITGETARTKMPGSIFGLLYIDPLANLDPLAREMIEYRTVTERFGYLLQRMPLIFSWAAELVLLRSLSSDETQRFSNSIARFAEATEKFADHTKAVAATVSHFPDVLSAERKASIEQISAELGQRQEQVFKDLDSQQRQVRESIDQARGAIVDAKSIVAEAKGLSAQTVADSERAVRRSVDRIFVWVLVIVLVGTMCAIGLLLIARKGRSKMRAS